MSKYLETLPQYHFDRDDFCKVFGEVFTDDEIIDIDVMCGYPQNTENFLLLCWCGSQRVWQMYQGSVRRY